MKKEAFEHYFKHKKVTVLGLGLLGRGVGDTRFLAEHGSDVIVTDKKTQAELASSYEALKGYSNITFRLGEHVLADFEKRDFILKAAGVPLDSEYVRHAHVEHVPVYMSAALVSSIIMKELPHVTVIGVTGTRGKSTTTHLIAHILRENGLRTHVGGNVRGVANLPLLEDIEDGDYLVLELDSWQLQGFGDMKISPHIAVFTSFMDDHMNYYGNDKELYFNDKAHIFKYQNEYDVLVASKQAYDQIQQREKVRDCIVAEPRDVPMKLIGEHNHVAAGMAYEVALQCGLDDEQIDKAIATGMPVDGRLEDMGLISGVRVFNDNNATTPDAVIAGVRAIEQTYGIKPILITGGADKGLSLAAYEDCLMHHTKECIFLAGTGTDKITLPKVHLFEDLRDCVKEAFALAREGDIILFSPGFASFSKYFNNEYERNDVFVQEVQTYRQNTL